MGIKLKRSGIASKAPVIADLELGDWPATPGTVSFI